jgi:hypothetical protein
MKRLPSAHTHLLPIAALALAGSLAACGQQIFQIEIETADGRSATAATGVAAGFQPTQTATFGEPTPTGTFGPPPAEPLPAATVTQPPALPGGEWLMVTSAQGLWMSRADGSQAAVRIHGPVLVPVPLSDAISPDGRLLVYQTLAPSGNGCNNPVLNILPLTGADPAVVIPLTSSESACPGNSPVELDNVNQALTGRQPFSWSPDGGRLAFIGAQDGPSADLYEYYRTNGQIIRLTDGPDQAFRTLWSPDGQWIVHAAVSSFGSGAGYGMTGFYAARADGGEVISLYPIGERSMDEQGAGWLDPHTLVAYTQEQPCGPKILRLVDLSARNAETVFEGCMSDVAVGHGSVLFAQPSDLAVYEENPKPGLYLIPSADRRPRMISSGDIERIEWAEEIGAFLAVTRDYKVLEISTAGDIRELPAMAPRPPTVSPGGRWWAYYQLAQPGFSDTDGIFAGEYGRGFRQIFEGSVSSGKLIFSPDGNSLYFVTKTGDLYRAQAPDWSSVLLASGVEPSPYDSTDMAWWNGD